MKDQERKTIDERRQSDRFVVNTEFSQLAPGTLPFISNLSETGVFVHSRERLPVGTFVELTFTVLLDDPVVISGPGIVVHHLEEPQGMGIEFANLSPEMILRIADVIRQHRSEVISEDSMPTPGIRGFRTRELSAEEFESLTISSSEFSDKEEASQVADSSNLSTSLNRQVHRPGPSSGATNEPGHEDF